MLFFRATSSVHDVTPPGEPSVNSVHGLALNYFNVKNCKMNLNTNWPLNLRIHGLIRWSLSQRVTQRTSWPDAPPLWILTSVFAIGHCRWDFHPERQSFLLGPTSSGGSSPSFSHSASGAPSADEVCVFLSYFTEFEYAMFFLCRKVCVLYLEITYQWEIIQCSIKMFLPFCF